MSTGKMNRNVSLGNNQGTYFGSEAIKAIGTCDPRHADSEIFIGGNGRVDYRGCRPNRAPGRFRKSEWWVRLTNEQKAQLDTLLA